MIMEKFRKKLQKDTRLIGICCLFLGIFMTLAGILVHYGYWEINPVAENNHWRDFWQGMIMGGSCGFLLFMVFFIARNLAALHDEARLKKLYAQEKDERTIQIVVYARSRACQIFLFAGLAAAFIAGLFSATVCLTILGCVLLQSLTGLALKVYYCEKF